MEHCTYLLWFYKNYNFDMSVYYYYDNSASAFFEATMQHVEAV